MKKKIELIVIGLYTFLVLQAIYPFLFYFIPNTSGDFLDTKIEFDLLNTHLMALIIGLFLNVLLILYSKEIGRKFKAITLIVYTFVNLKLLSSPLFHLDYYYGQNAIYNGLPLVSLSLFIGLFLNAAVIIYWLRHHNNHSGIIH